MWSDDLRALIERELARETFDIIGMTETGGPGLGIDCRARDGIHVWEDHYYCEVVDPATGAPRADGERGRAGGSDAHREGLPLDPLPHAGPHADASAASRARAGGRICGWTVCAGGPTTW